MMFRGVRGATVAKSNTREAIMEATEELIRKLIDVNGIEEDQVASVIFTSTPDLNAAFPAAAARHIGWTRVALLGAQEIDTPEGMKRCIRVLIHWNTDRTLDAIQHVYMHGTEKMRPDLYPNNKLAVDD
jgi:chorismate mutase